MEVLPETPSLLKDGHIVHFSDGWNDIWAGKYFRISKCQQMEYDVHRIISPGSSNTMDISFEPPPTGGVTSQKISLQPVNPKSLFEMLIGIKGQMFVYPRYANRYYDQLEVTNCQPNPSDADLAALGFYDCQKSPWYAPKVREYTVSNQEPPHLLLFNPYQNDEKVVLTFLINRCLMEPAKQGSFDPKVARDINYYKGLMW